MARVITIMNQKGGIGKTTSAIAIASILHQQGKKTLLVDADAQGNASDTYRAKIDGAITLYDVLLETDRVNIRDAVQQTAYGDIVAGDPLLRRADTILGSDMNGPFRLADALENVQDYDYVIIDTAPALSELTKNALLAADDVIIPVSADRYAIQGLSNIVQSVNETKRRQNPKIRLLGIILVAYPERTVLGKEIKAELESIADKLGTRIFAPPIRRTIKVQQAHVERMPLIYYDENCTAAKDYKGLVAQAFGKE